MTGGEHDPESDRPAEVDGDARLEGAVPQHVREPRDRAERQGEREVNEDGRDAARRHGSVPTTA